jgi:hypothetical protein
MGEHDPVTARCVESSPVPGWIRFGITAAGTDYSPWPARAMGPKPIGFGNCWVVAGIIVQLSFLSRPVCLPVLARLWRPTTPGRSRTPDSWPS